MSQSAATGQCGFRKAPPGLLGCFEIQFRLVRTMISLLLLTHVKRNIVAV